MQAKLISQPFGVLKNVALDGYGNLLITNSSGRQVKMSSSKWSRQIPQIHKKCLEHVGYDVCIVTSQTTAAWSPSQYFCDIKTSQVDAGL